MVASTPLPGRFFFNEMLFKIIYVTSYLFKNALSDWSHNFNNFIDIAKTMDMTCTICIQINNKIVFAIIQSSK